jgi:hypothetical protein
MFTQLDFVLKSSYFCVFIPCRCDIPIPLQLKQFNQYLINCVIFSKCNTTVGVEFDNTNIDWRMISVTTLNCAAFCFIPIISSIIYKWRMDINVQ